MLRSSGPSGSLAPSVWIFVCRCILGWLIIISHQQNCDQRLSYFPHDSQSHHLNHHIDLKIKPPCQVYLTLLKRKHLPREQGMLSLSCQDKQFQELCDVWGKNQPLHNQQYGFLSKTQNSGQRLSIYFLNLKKPGFNVNMLRGRYLGQSLQQISVINPKLEFKNSQFMLSHSYNCISLRAASIGNSLWYSVLPSELTTAPMYMNVWRGKRKGKWEINN